MLVGGGGGAGGGRGGAYVLAPIVRPLIFSSTPLLFYFLPAFSLSNPGQGSLFKLWLAGNRI